MGRRIDVELTSSRGDGTWTWRAAGAKQPKGVLDAKLLYEGAQVGDVVRAEADFEMEGILITSVLPPREKRSEPDRLEVIGPPREHQGVTSSLVPKSERPRTPRGRDRDRDGDRGARPGGPTRPRDESRAGGRPPRSDDRPRPDRSRAAGSDDHRGPRRPERDHAGRSERPEQADGARAPGADRGPRPARPDRTDRRREAPAPEAAPKPKRLAPANVHRAAVVQSLPPEQQPIAEQVLRGGLPAVRQAIETQNARLREEGQPEVHAGPLVAMAEQLLPQLKAADWRDRAEAAAKVVDEVSLRDLRSVVAGADLARDDEGRLLAGSLRQALERRVEEQRQKWVTDMATSLDEGRLVRALRLSAHPPDTSTRFPAELAVRLSEAAGAAMTAEASPDRWATLLEAVADSPVRRTVKPVALPATPGEPLLQAARQASGRIPALAAMLGITMPPPPGPPRPARPGARPPRSGGPGGGGRRRPPAPTGAGPARPVPPPPPSEAQIPGDHAASVDGASTPATPATPPIEPALEAAADSAATPVEPAPAPVPEKPGPAPASDEPAPASSLGTDPAGDGGGPDAPPPPAEAPAEPAAAGGPPAVDVVADGG